MTLCSHLFWIELQQRRFAHTEEHHVVDLMLAPLVDYGGRTSLSTVGFTRFISGVVVEFYGVYTYME